MRGEERRRVPSCSCCVQHEEKLIKEESGQVGSQAELHCRGFHKLIWTHYCFEKLENRVKVLIHKTHTHTCTEKCAQTSALTLVSVEV